MLERDHCWSRSNPEKNHLILQLQGFCMGEVHIMRSVLLLFYSQHNTTSFWDKDLDILTSFSSVSHNLRLVGTLTRANAA